MHSALFYTSFILDLNSRMELTHSRQFKFPCYMDRWFWAVIYKPVQLQIPETICLQQCHYDTWEEISKKFTKYLS